jgi:hypothetical protein
MGQTPVVKGNAKTKARNSVRFPQIDASARLKGDGNE